MHTIVRATVVVVLACSGCFGPLEPDVGDPQRERCVNEDSDPGTDVSFERDVFSGIFHRTTGAPGPGCRCHLPSDPTPIGFELGGLDLSSYSGLRRGGAISGASAVVPGQPCDSGLVLKLSEGAPFGSRMPQDGPPYLTDEEIQIVKDWIAEGALDD